jgi:hypothetical protein
VGFVRILAVGRMKDPSDKVWMQTINQVLQSGWNIRPRPSFSPTMTRPEASKRDQVLGSRVGSIHGSPNTDLAHRIINETFESQI